MFVEVAGIEQWLEIEGDGERPVLLLVHGGPGGSTPGGSGPLILGAGPFSRGPTFMIRSPGSSFARSAADFG